MIYFSPGHLHWCEECGDDVIQCDVAHCEYNDEGTLDRLYEEHWEGFHGSKPRNVF